MKEYLREHTGVKIALITLFFIVGMALTLVGWKMSGDLTGLGIMIVGLVLLLIALYIYNKPYTD